MNRIAIMGSTGHIAKNIINIFKQDNSKDLYLFSRGKFLSYETFFKYDYNVIINCVGFGNPEDIEHAGIQLFLINEEYDNKVLNYLNEHPNTKYIYISSGVVHNEFLIDRMNFYQVSKISSEAKHRSLQDLNIVDIRLYSFFTRHANLDAKFFMSALIKATQEKTLFVTNHKEMIRDYINPRDLVNLINLSLKPKKLNNGFDIYSLKSAKKSEILEYFQDKYGLRIKYDNRFKSFSSVGKPVYVSPNKKAETLGYKPAYTSMQTIKEESKYFLH